MHHNKAMFITYLYQIEAIKVFFNLKKQEL